MSECQCLCNSGVSSRGGVVEKGNHPPLKLVVSHNNKGALFGPEVSLSYNSVRPFPLSEGRGVFTLGLLDFLIKFEGRYRISVAQVRCTSFERCVLRCQIFKDVSAIVCQIFNDVSAIVTQFFNDVSSIVGSF